MDNTIPTRDFRWLDAPRILPTGDGQFTAVFGEFEIDYPEDHVCYKVEFSAENPITQPKDGNGGSSRDRQPT